MSATLKYTSTSSYELTRAHPTDAGIDLCSIENVRIPAESRAIISTGIRVQLPPSTVMDVRPRSGLANKHGLTVLNAPGTIDEGYRGEVKVILQNTTKQAYSVTKGDRIAQLVVIPIIKPELVKVDKLNAGDRGEGSFGSTGY